jgi:Rad3-related DNA helicase
MNTDINGIKLKLATKLVKTLSLDELKKEEVETGIKYVFSKILEEKGFNGDDIDSIVEIYLDEYSFEDVFDIIVDAYASAFTEDELLDLINFFNTATGKMWICKYPTIVKDVLEATENYSRSVAEKILKRFQ